MAMGKAWWWTGLGLMALLAGCAERPETQVRTAFSERLSCDPSYVQVTRSADGGYEAVGCDKGSLYACPEGVCQFQHDLSAEQVKDLAAGVDKTSQLRLELTLEENVQFRFLATPEKSELVELTLIPEPPCPLELVLDGQRLELPKGSVDASLHLSRAVMGDVRVSDQVELRACSRPWLLSPRDLKKLRAYVREYEEALGGQTAPSKGGVGGRRPPAGGWPAWAALPAPPEALTGDPLAGTTLFEKLAPSVLRVEGEHTSGFSQGSAVAITPTLLIANCHVVEGALKIVVKQAKKKFTGRLRQSDPVKDRCVIEVAGASFTPVDGVRPYSELNVGEPLYTLGNPNGFDLTLADGILSALREEAGVRFIQTTAPISPGSSGGGLFDARGNLVGITTLVFAGEDRLNQSLNFAIAADLYFSP